MMKILTIGASPYLFVRNGRMHADIIESLIADGHEVSSAVWHHDESYFMPSEEGIHSYEKYGKAICQLYPFTPKTEEASPFVYELMKVVHPEIVITVGDYKDTNFIFAIKAMYPTLFKWVAIYTFDCPGITQSAKEAFEYTDYCISTSPFGLKELMSFANVEGEYFPYGPDHSKFFATKPISERDSVLCSSRNAQSSNIPAFVNAIAKQDVKAVIHTNMYDVGDYNLEAVKARYGANKVVLPEYYCSIKEGLTENGMTDLYNNSKIIVDCSIKSATGLSLLEGMACGCIPVGPAYGMIGEIISHMPEEFKCAIPYNIFVGQNEEEFAIISPTNLYSVLSFILRYDPQTMIRASNAAIDVSKKFSNTAFIDNLKRVLERVRSAKQTLVLDSL